MCVNGTKPEVHSLKGSLPGIIDNMYEAVQYPFGNTGMMNENILTTCMNKCVCKYGTYRCITGLFCFGLRLYVSGFCFCRQDEGRISRRMIIELGKYGGVYMRESCIYIKRFGRVCKGERMRKSLWGNGN